MTTRHHFERLSLPVSIINYTRTSRTEYQAAKPEIKDASMYYLVNYGYVYLKSSNTIPSLHLISTLITGNYWNKRCPLVLWWNWALVWPCWNVAENKFYDEDTWFLDASDEANPGECHLFGFSFIGHIGLVSRFHQRHNYCCWSFTQFRVYEWNQTWDCCSTLDYSVSKEWLLIRNMANRIVLGF